MISQSCHFVGGFSGVGWYNRSSIIIVIDNHVDYRFFKWHRLLRFTSSLSYDILLDDEICLSQIKDMLISLPFPQNITIIELRQAEPCYLYASYSAS